MCIPLFLMSFLIVSLSLVDVSGCVCLWLSLSLCLWAVALEYNINLWMLYPVIIRICLICLSWLWYWCVRVFWSLNLSYIGVCVATSNIETGSPKLRFFFPLLFQVGWMARSDQLWVLHRSWTSTLDDASEALMQHFHLDNHRILV